MTAARLCGHPLDGDAMGPPGFAWDEREQRPVYSRYTARETAERLGVSERTVRRWIEAGHLQADKIRGEFRIDITEALRYAETARSGRGESPEFDALRSIALHLERLTQPERDRVLRWAVDRFGIEGARHDSV